jgi:hypothetical protein
MPNTSGKHAFFTTKLQATGNAGRAGRAWFMAFTLKGNNRRRRVRAVKRAANPAAKRARYQ